MLRVIFNLNMVFDKNIVRFLLQKFYTGTEPVGLVYNKFTININYANKTRR